MRHSEMGEAKRRDSYDSGALREELQVFDVEARRGAKNKVASFLFSQWE